MLNFGGVKNFESMKLTIIGAGNMGGATARGLLKSGAVKACDLTLADRNESILEVFAAEGVKVSSDNASAVKGADVVMVVVKPWIVEAVISEIKASLDYSSQILVMIAAGVRPEQLSEWLGKDASGVAIQSMAVIPNTAVEILQGMTFIAPVEAGEGAVALVKGLFDKLGSAMVVPFNLLGAGTALASCGIAYAIRYIHAASQGGVEMGFYPADAVKIVCQTVQSAAGLIMEHGSHPEVEIDKVTTPGGVTIKGLNAMEEAGFTNAVIKGLKASK